MKKERPRKPASYITHQIAILIPYWKLDVKLDICRSVADVRWLKNGCTSWNFCGEGVPKHVLLFKAWTIVDGRNPANHLGCKKPCKYWGSLPSSTGESWISEPSIVCQFTQDLRIERSRNHKSCYHRTLKCSTGASLEVVEPDIWFFRSLELILRSHEKDS